MYRDQAIENALDWAKRQGYSFADEAIAAYAAQSGTVAETDHYGITSFKPAPDTGD